MHGVVLEGLKKKTVPIIPENAYNELPTSIPYDPN